mmetsp:Transcript_20099/g.62436  ORF Transcript_20099/g.62436 Transcript_20099/m.62436 type:complete len:211 (+) Transcript_20099:1180-1812(+)
MLKQLRRGAALGRRVLQHPRDEGNEVGRQGPLHRGPQLRFRDRGAARGRLPHHAHRLGRRGAGDELDQRRSKRPHVGLIPVPVAAVLVVAVVRRGVEGRRRADGELPLLLGVVEGGRDLRRDPPGCADGREPPSLRARDGARGTEVAQLHDAVAADHDVRPFHVAMHEVAVVVQVLQAQQRVDGNAQQGLLVQRHALCDDLVQVAARDPF